ncbi:MAG: hypothetical protein Q9172_007814 [Xanthocarpia lactea]
MFKSLLLSFILLVLVSYTTAYDYEPGDTLNRTMCYCVAGEDSNTMQQADWDSHVFLNTTSDRRINYIYQFDYYNHRCNTVDDDAYNWNDCLDWEKQNVDKCAQFQLSPDFALGKFPHREDTWRDMRDGVKGKMLSWEFCYGFHGDKFDGRTPRDWFRFDGGKRGLPSKQDYVAPMYLVKQKCQRLCAEKFRMFMFSPAEDVFNRMDGFQHFDDICTKHMDCKAMPGYVDKKHPTPTQAPMTLVEASTVFESPTSIAKG